MRLNLTINCIKELKKCELIELLFDYSNYVMRQLEEGNHPVNVMEFYDDKWELV